MMVVDKEVDRETDKVTNYHLMTLISHRRLLLIQKFKFKFTHLWNG